MAGPMSAQDMQSQFQPAPFGSYPPPSAFATAMQTPLWDHFRSIDLDKQAKVLEVGIGHGSFFKGSVAGCSAAARAVP